MKYKSVTIQEDPFVLKNFTDVQISKITGYSPSYVSLLRRGLRVAPEKVYLKIRDSLAKHLTK